MASTINEAIRDLVVPKVQAYLKEHGLESFGIHVPTPNDVPIVEVQNSNIVVSMVDPSTEAICEGQLPKILVGYLNLLEEAKDLDLSFYYSRMSERATATWAGLLKWNRNPKVPSPTTGNPNMDKFLQEFSSSEEFADTEFTVEIAGTVPRPEYQEIYAIMCETIGVNPTYWSVEDRKEFVKEVERYVNARLETKFADVLPDVLASIVSVLERELGTREQKKRLESAHNEIKRLEHIEAEKLTQAGIAAVVRTFKELKLTAGTVRIDALKRMYPNHVAQILDALKADA